MTLTARDLKPGDVLAYRGNGLVAWVVRVFSGSDWHHVAIVTPYGIVDARPWHRVGPRPDSEMLPAYRVESFGQWSVLATQRLEAMRLLPYSFLDGLFARLGVPPFSRGKQCAEAVRELLAACGVSLPPDKNLPDHIVFALLERGASLQRVVDNAP